MGKTGKYPMHWERMLNYGKVEVRCHKCCSLFSLKGNYDYTIDKVWKITKCPNCSTLFTHLQITKVNYWYWPISVPVDTFNAGTPLVHIIWNPWFDYQQPWDKEPERGVELPVNINCPINQKLLKEGYFHKRRLEENERFKHE